MEMRIQKLEKQTAAITEAYMSLSDEVSAQENSLWSVINASLNDYHARLKALEERCLAAPRQNDTFTLQTKAPSNE
jgi:uncharacterized coiled-coil protein SlyX